MTQPERGKPDPGGQELIPRLEAREPGFSREQFEIVIDACRKTLVALAVTASETHRRLDRRGARFRADRFR